MEGFCEKCNEVRLCAIKNVKKQKNIKGVNVEYMGKAAYCNECGDEIFNAKTRDYNLDMLDKAYREKTGLISVSEMGMILKKYNIGKRPLSSLLGWGEGTLTRYLNGDIPTKEYSDTLKRILKNHKFMKQKLEQNKDNITDIAFRRCEKALSQMENITEITKDSEEKIDYVVKYLLLNSEEITPLALQKELYYSQGFYKAFTGNYLFYNNCEAWIHGPVYRSVYFKYKDHGFNPIEEKYFNYGDIKLKTEETNLLDCIIKNFGCYSGKILEKMTHVEEPWRVSRKGLSDNENSVRIINKELIADYFNKIKLKHKMVNISDIRDYSKDLFDKIYN